MKSNYLNQVAQLRAKNLNMMITAIAMMLAALFVSIMLPSLLITYVYASQQLLEAPLAYELVAPISFLIGIGYFLFAAIGNLLRAKRIKHLKMECMTMGNDCCGGGTCGDDDALMKEMESLVKSLEVKKPAKKKVAKSSKKKKTTTKSKK